jgi:hypothetical protein
LSLADLRTLERLAGVDSDPLAELSRLAFSEPDGEAPPEASEPARAIGRQFADTSIQPGIGITGGVMRPFIEEVGRGYQQAQAGAGAAIALPENRTGILTWLARLSMGPAGAAMPDEAIRPLAESLSKRAEAIMPGPDLTMWKDSAANQVAATRGFMEGTREGQREGYIYDVARGLGQSAPMVLATAGAVATGGALLPVSLASTAQVPLAGYTEGQLEYLDELDEARAKAAAEGKPLPGFDLAEMQARGAVKGAIEGAVEAGGATLGAKALGRWVLGSKPARAVLGPLAAKGAEIAAKTAVGDAASRFMFGTVERGFLRKVGAAVAISAAEEGGEEIASALLNAPFTAKPLDKDLADGLYASFVGAGAGGLGGGAVSAGVAARDTVRNVRESFSPESAFDAELRRRHELARSIDPSGTLTKVADESAVVGSDYIASLRPEERPVYLSMLADRVADTTKAADDLLAARQQLDYALLGAREGNETERQVAKSIEEQIGEIDQRLQEVRADRVRAEAEWRGASDAIGSNIERADPDTVLSDMAVKAPGLTRAERPEWGSRIEREVEAMGGEVVWFDGWKRGGFFSMRSPGTIYLNRNASPAKARAVALEEVFHTIQMHRPEVAKVFMDKVAMGSVYRSGARYLLKEGDDRINRAAIERLAIEAGIESGPESAPRMAAGSARIEEEGGANAFAGAAEPMLGPLSGLYRAASRMGLRGRDAAAAVAVLDAIERSAALAERGPTDFALSPLARTLLWAKRSPLDYAVEIGTIEAAERSEAEDTVSMAEVSKAIADDMGTSDPVEQERRIAALEAISSGTQAGDGPVTTVDRRAFIASRRNPVARLSRFAPTMFRETSLERALEFIDKSYDTGDLARSEYYMAESPDMALGQGENRGVLLEFDADGLNGTPNVFHKPMSQDAFLRGNGEFSAFGNGVSAYRDSLRRVTVRPDAGGQPWVVRRMRSALAALVSSGEWTLESSGDGSAVYTRTRPASDPIASADPAVSTSSQIDTPAFKRWFGKSKVVDADGKPLVVYHGTRALFDAFDPGRIGDQGRSEGPGFYFTESPQIASRYAGDSGTVVNAYLRIENPLAYDAPPFSERVMRDILLRASRIEASRFGSSEADGLLANFGDTYGPGGVRAAASQGAKLFMSEDDALSQIGGLVGSGVSPDIVMEAVTAVTGHDGVVSRGFSNEGRSDERIFVAFSPTQIKSATTNSGAFDPNDPRISYASELPELPLAKEIAAELDKARAAVAAASTKLTEAKRTKGGKDARIDEARRELAKAKSAERAIRMRLAVTASAYRTMLAIGQREARLSGVTGGMMEARKALMDRMRAREDAVARMVAGLREAYTQRSMSRMENIRVVLGIAAEAAKMVPARSRGALLTRVSQATTIQRAFKVYQVAVKLASDAMASEARRDLARIRRRMNKRGMRNMTEQEVDSLLDQAEAELRDASGKSLRSIGGVIGAVDLFSRVAVSHFARWTHALAHLRRGPRRVERRQAEARQQRYSDLRESLLGLACEKQPTPARRPRSADGSAGQDPAAVPTGELRLLHLRPRTGGHRRRASWMELIHRASIRAKGEAALEKARHRPWPGTMPSHRRRDTPTWPTTRSAGGRSATPPPRPSRCTLGGETILRHRRGSRSPSPRWTIPRSPCSPRRATRKRARRAS